MFDLFSDILAYRDNAFTRMDARAKLLLCFAGLIAVLLSRHMAFPLAVFGFSLGAMLGLRQPLRLVLVRLGAPLGMVAVLIFLFALFFGSTEFFSLSFWGKRITFTEEGIRRGLLTGSKVLGAGSLILLLSLITPAHRIFRALLWFRVPRGWVEIAMLMYRYIFSLLDDTADIFSAQRLRLGYCGIRRSLSSFGNLAGTVLIRSFDQAARTHEAMVLRGYKGSLLPGPLPDSCRSDWARLAGGAAVLAAAYFFLEWRTG
jgi:cobalt/nickel transport system permease protein